MSGLFICCSRRWSICRTKLRKKLVCMVTLLLLLLLRIMTSPSRKNTNGHVLSTEDMLHNKMVLRREIIRERFCDLPKNTYKVRRDLDFKSFVRPMFLDNFKNPCFVQNLTIDHKSKAVFGCLPYFLIAGFPKAGTTDMWTRLLNHPDIVLQHLKEPMFFNKGKTETAFKDSALKYISFFSRTAKELHRLVCPSECRSLLPYHYAITGEGSVDTAFDNIDWQLLPGNEGCREPVVTNADYVYHLNPDMKIIFALRNPTDRLYSDYIYESRFHGYTISQENFHQLVVSTIHNFTQCLLSNTERSCVYNKSIDSEKVRLRVGMYHIYIEDWLSVFHPRNVFVIRAEDTSSDRKFEVYRHIFQFLQIRPFTRQEENRIFARGHVNTRSKPEKDMGEMWEQTRQLLYKFYQPFNDKLKLLLPNIDYNALKSNLSNA